jgi:hypothetical protein
LYYIFVTTAGDGFLVDRATARVKIATRKKSPQKKSQNTTQTATMMKTRPTTTPTTGPEKQIQRFYRG